MQGTTVLFYPKTDKICPPTKGVNQGAAVSRVEVFGIDTLRQG